MATHKQAQVQQAQPVPPQMMQGVDCRYDNHTGACILPFKPCTMIEYRGELFRYASIRNY